MPTTGPISHLDISAGYPERSIPFYDALLVALGFERWPGPSKPGYGAWNLRLADGSLFGIEVRPGRTETRDRRYDRYAPGPHHLAFHADSPAKVDEVHAAMIAAGAEILDPPADYSERYAQGYYAAFYADPDGFKVEVVYEPTSNP